MTNIDETGAPGMMYNSFPHMQEHDPYSGDYGLGFFGISLESGGYFVDHKDYGPICYLCELSKVKLAAATDLNTSLAPTSGNSGRGVLVSGSFTLKDAYRQRFYFEPLGYCSHV
jgi:hypothetical protein